MEEITIEFLQIYLRDKHFDLLPTQGKISHPMIVSYCDMLRNGQTPRAITTVDGVIVDGHHRYISGHILGRLPDSCNWTKSSANEPISWCSVVVDENDFRKKTTFK